MTVEELKDRMGTREAAQWDEKFRLEDEAAEASKPGR